MHLDGEPQADRISLPVGTITVAGEGRVAARPDLAVTTLGVDVYATSLSEAMAEAAGTMERVWQTLRGAGLQDADLRTVRYSVQVERPYHQGTGRASDSPGYRVVNLVEARIRDLTRVGRHSRRSYCGGGQQRDGRCVHRRRCRQSGESGQGRRH